MPMDLSNELKNRLKSSKHATVSNLSKSATASAVPSSATSTAQHDDAVSLVRNLTNLGKPPAQLRDPLKMEPDIASASEGESSGGREISEIIKNSAVARRRKFNEGFFYAKLKNQPPPTTAQHFWPHKQNSSSYSNASYYVQQQIQKQQQLQLQQLQQKYLYK